jgi:hypothetical protein
MTGNIAAIKYIYDRIDGMPIQTIAQTTEEKIIRIITPDQPEKETPGSDD